MSRQKVKSRAHKFYEEQAKRFSSVEKLFKEWVNYWAEAGPVRFAEEVLTSPDDIPEYPNWEKIQEYKWCEGCKKDHYKFNPETGIPVHMILSEDQKEFIGDLWHGVELAIVTAGRGCGKTLSLGAWDIWCLCCSPQMDDISALGGSSKQSKLLQKYINQWRMDVPMIAKCIPRSLRGIEPKCINYLGAEINFLPCSATSVRGPHVPQVQIDECCVAESKSEEGREAVDAIWWQIVGKRVGKIILVSTTQYVFGKFYEYLSNPEKYGFKKYVWAIAEHVSGKPPEVTYKDRNPDNWRPRVWWVTQEDIKKLRPKSSDSEWLCEALGRPSLASGQVLNPEDFEFIVCKACEECYPYKYDDEFKCLLVNKLKLGGMDKGKFNPLLHVYDRRAGFDYGKVTPCALTVMGRKVNMLLVLYSDEMRDENPREILSWIERELGRFKVETFIPDPAIAGQEITRLMMNKGYSVWVIATGDKDSRVWRVRRIVERHLVIIPKAFWKLTDSMRKVSWDKRGKIRKLNDHSFDTMQYATEGYDDIVEGDISQGATGVFQELLKGQYQKSTQGRDLIRGVKIWE